MLKKAKYWREFSAPSRTEAEKAAAAWWAEQSGLDRISGWTLPAPAQAPSDGSCWTVTIIYTSSDSKPETTTIH